ncbi:MAG: NAD(P)H-hydrate epimerase [Balneolaceae bacterium]
MNYFQTENFVKISSVTAEKMKLIDEIAVHKTGPNLYQMMENAGRNLALKAIELVERIAERQPKITILAGTGGNGGGGLCAARHLANHGYEVSVCITDKEKLKDVSRFQLDVLGNTTASLVTFSDLNKLSYPDLLVDAILGYSLTSPPINEAKDFILWMNTQPVPILSLDIPSGVHATTGQTPGVFVKPDITLTLALPKSGLEKCVTGRLFLADIGIPAETFRLAGVDYVSPFRKSFIVRLTDM